MKQNHGAIHASSGEAESAFYAALSRGDLNALMALWADDEDVVCIHPGGGRLVGVRAVRESYSRILSGGPLRVSIDALRVQSGVMVAVHSLVERIEVPGARQTRIAHVAVTNVYMKGPDGWRIVLHHASPGEAVDHQTQAHQERPSGRLH